MIERLIERPIERLDQPEDRSAREAALDTTCSIVVQAPAGSGKTELLAMRFLKLLAEVEDPEEILAITFTKAAAAEMRHRVLAKLTAAKLFVESGIVPEGEDRSRLAIAGEALENSNRRGWRLIDQPQRLNIQTIDSLCLRIAHRMPLSGRPGAMLPPTESASPLYRSAARKTMERLGGEDRELNAALKALLMLRDGRLANVEGLLAQMLGTRDQWARVFPLSGEIDWQAARVRLESPFHREIARVLGEVRTLFAAHPKIVDDLFQLANYACGNARDFEIQRLLGMSALPPSSSDFVEHWLCVCKFVLTEGDKPREGYDIRHGFPKDGKRQKDKMKTLVADLSKIPGLFDLLVEIRSLPPPRYSEDQWQTLRHIFVALRQAVAELNEVFLNHGAVDFAELNAAAMEVLRDGNDDAESNPRLLHLLVDEFQDTSRLQHNMIAALLGHWTPQQSGTFFLVGDPMQSIYMFRQAEVELFDLASRHGIDAAAGRLPAKTLQLTTNFRSNAGVVKPLNALFATVFPYEAKPDSAAVDFLPGVAMDRDEPDSAYTVHPSFVDPRQSNANALPQNGRQPSPAETSAQQEADEVVKIVERHLPRIAQARARNEEFTVAVLGRGRNHLVRIAAALRDAKIPFRAVELEALGERQEILDLQSLTRALLHPMDRVAWLSVLRAPWCGLELRDLHRLCGTDERRSSGGAVARQIEERLPSLEDEAQRRVKRVIGILDAARRHRYCQGSLASWIERTWHSLGGDDCVDAAGRENALAYFRMIEGTATDGVAATGEAMKDQLNRLFANPDPSVGERCGVQLMTMHKAKGLGFHVVILPGLHRPSGWDSPALVQYLERITDAGSELLAAPIGRSGEDPSALYRWVGRQKQNREIEERKRLLYVACTRAREELHLFATATVTNNGISCKPSTLLFTAWPSLEGSLQTAYAQQAVAKASLPANNVVGFPSAPVKSGAVGGVLGAVAAGAGPTLLYRLPDDWKPRAVVHDVVWKATSPASVAADTPGERSRPQGSRASRVLGTTVHSIFEHAARLFSQGNSEAKVRAALPNLRKLAVAFGRNHGLLPHEAESLAHDASSALERALSDAHGVWILSADGEAQAESSWTGIVDGVPRELRIDRSFRAGETPLSQSGNCLWIIDYKTATHGPSGLADWLDGEKQQYAPQLEGYASMMRLAYGSGLQLRLGLYYPLLPKLVWWSAETQPG